ncbi:(R)-mandelonitrile lyase-like [Platanthera zijinensis]|uniref:(R)-mandelonitrile lyase-like n=1 Tax=Platanthera zijinensis TaxID=2320716 RepID=A0AAP0AVP5_9ASPA
MLAAVLGSSSTINAGFYSRAHPGFFHSSGVSWDMALVLTHLNGSSVASPSAQSSKAGNPPSATACSRRTSRLTTATPFITSGEPRSGIHHRLFRQAPLHRRSS